MGKSALILLALVVLLVISVVLLVNAEALETKTFPSGTFVIPMDTKQNDTIRAFGFVHDVLRNGGTVYRIIEPPDITLYVDNMTYNGSVFSGGPMLVMQSDADKITSASVNFSTVTYFNLTQEFSSNQVFTINKPTKILVVHPSNLNYWWGHTEEVLDDMGIPYDLVNTSVVESDPSILLGYDLVIDDCAGWYPETPPPNVQESMRTLVENGGELIFTCIAMRDLAATFPGYINVEPSTFGDWVGNCSVHNPPINKTGNAFSPEFPSQYNGSEIIRMFALSDGWKITGVSNDSVRIILDTDDFNGEYSIFACYFPYGEGIVEAFKYHPQEQTTANGCTEDSYRLSATLYGNKFVHISAPSIELNKTANKYDVRRGENVTFTLNVTNLGDEDFTAVNVVDVLPKGLDYADAATHPPDSIIENPDGTTTITWNNVSSLASHTSVKVVFNATVNGSAPAGILINRATATGFAPSGNVSDEDTADVRVTEAPGIKIEKKINGVEVYHANLSEVVKIELNVTNIGNVTLDTVNVTDMLPNGLSYVSGSASRSPNSTNGIITWYLTNLAPGSSFNLTFRANVTKNETMRNYANVTGKNGSETVFAEDDAYVTVREYHPSINIIKRAKPYRTSVGENILFTLDVVNTGDVNLASVNVTDVLPKGLKYTLASANPPDSSNITNPDGSTTIIWHLGTLAFHESKTITFNVTAEATGEFTNYANATGESSYGVVCAEDTANIRVGGGLNRVPVLTPFGIATLIWLLSLVVVLNMRKGMRRRRL